MIQLNPDYLLFQTDSGEAIPCSAELITIELIGEAAAFIDPDIIRQVASAVLHYFKEDLKKDVVSINEFSQALERVLRGLGFTVETEPESPERGAVQLDLCKLAAESAGGIELGFFPTLRGYLRQQIRDGSDTVAFEGLRACVKELAGAKRWTPRCQILSDQIVEYLRECFAAEASGDETRLVIR